MKIEDGFYEEDEYLLLRLKFYLNIELSTSLLMLLGLLNLLTIFLAAFASLIFSFYLFYVLYKTKKYGWITLFISAVFVPSVSLLFINISYHSRIIILLLAMGAFYFLCSILRFVINDWCEGFNWKKVLNEKKKEEEEMKKLEQKYFGNR